jgi:hypothetical protein
MRQTYRVLAISIALGVVVQAASVALGWFLTLKDLDDGQVLDKDFDYNAGQIVHSIFGLMVIPLLAIILFVISFFAKIDSGVKWAGYVLLAVILQIALAFIAFGVPAVGALHGINAFVVAGLAGFAGRRAAEAPTTETATPVSA